MNKQLRFLVIFSLMGCATTRSQDVEVGQLKKQILELQKVQGFQSNKIDELNNKLVLLSEKKTVGAPEPSPSLAPLAELKERPASSPVPLEVVPVGNAEKLYVQLQGYAKGGQYKEMQKIGDALLKNFRMSPWTNDAIFMMGETYYEKGHYLNAAEQFEKLYKNYPDGNKAVSSLYALGLCYEKLGKPNEATEAYQNIIAIYPGSREALKAAQNLQALESPQ